MNPPLKRIRMVETSHGYYTVTDDKTACFTNVHQGIDVSMLMRLVAKLDLDFAQMAFLCTALVSGPPKCDRAASIVNFDFAPLAPAGVRLTTMEIGHG